MGEMHLEDVLLEPSILPGAFYPQTVPFPSASLCCALVLDPLESNPTYRRVYWGPWFQWVRTQDHGGDHGGRQAGMVLEQ